ncbi:hypothetical protein GHT06_010815 [Daphnia sinensis]|uniref:Uncharacterized protein n=1 Tax=Daphnia sinensis TaxID=1820382 RepID=A0AAD5Q0S7_9CRUS|nr:hypothetical protein GHT06_010815 [Daphnia sinensis]
MFKAVAVLVIFGCALAAPTPRVDDQNLVQANNFSPSNAIKELESSLDNIDAIFKHSFQKIGGNRDLLITPIRQGPYNRIMGANKKFDFVDEGEEQFPVDIKLNPTNRPLRQDSREEYRGAQARDPLVGTEEAAARAIDSPLFFNTFDHAHMVTGYAERRRDRPMLLRSIRPDFPFSDISRRRQRV